MAKRAGRDQALDLLDSQQIVEAPLLVTWDEEGSSLPVFAEKALGLDRADAAL